MSVESNLAAAIRLLLLELPIIGLILAVIFIPPIVFTWLDLRKRNHVSRGT